MGKRLDHYLIDYEKICMSSLFKGSKAGDVEGILGGVEHSIYKYKKGEMIFSAGECISRFGYVLQGSVQIENIDILGNKSILGVAMTGDVFGEAYASLPEQPLLVDVIAREESVILFINVSKLYAHEDSSPQADILIHNLLRISSKKNLNLSMRIFHSSPKTIRARLYSYFSEQVAMNHGNPHIIIPLDRQQLADYLSVDRTALSKELGKMQREGLIEFKKNEFTIKIIE